ncbi:MAG: glycoside hydrolase family 19 protein [Rubrivivax sp.]
MATTPTLSAPVGPGQANLPDDLKLLRQALNDFSSRGFLQPSVTLPAEGGWDAAVAAALQAVENQYFYGEADPDNKLETQDTLFQFLVQAGSDSQRVAASLSGETYALAAAMVPGGVDRSKRTTVSTPQLVNGKMVMKREVKVEKVSGNIRSYLPFILQALTQRGLNDTDMLMMALGTIRAESAAFQPIDEGISKYNTSPKGTEGRHAFDLYDDRADLGNSGDGDGALYKGRGFVQLTGHDNYQTVGRQVGVDLLADPDRANEPAVAAAVLAQFLKNKEAAIRQALKKNDLGRARRLVNGGSHGLQAFRDAFAAGRRYLGIVVPAKARQAVKAKAAAKPAAPKPAVKAPAKTATPAAAAPGLKAMPLP